MPNSTNTNETSTDIDTVCDIDYPLDYFSTDIETPSNPDDSFSCDISIDKKSTQSFVNCTTHQRSKPHICSCQDEQETEETKLKLITHQQNPMYHDVNLNNLILKLMSTDYQSYG